jgi:hypothetical protein
MITLTSSPSLSSHTCATGDLLARACLAAHAKRSFRHHIGCAGGSSTSLPAQRYVLTLS